VAPRHRASRHHPRDRRRREGSAALRGRHVGYSGGLTGSRGHVGENAGARALVAWLAHGQAAPPGADVFGCPLFTPES
jgi:hypothetical protein